MTVVQMRLELAGFLDGEQEVLVRHDSGDGPELIPIQEVKRTIDPDTGDDIIVIET
jgi:hypothetical protein